MSEHHEEPMEFTNEEDLYTAGDKRPEPSAPPKTARVKVIVNWPGQLSKRWHLSLQKALQTWFRSDLFKDVGKCEVCSLVPICNDPLCVEVQITPPEALKVFKNNTTATLNLRDQNANLNVHVKILLDETVLEKKEPYSKVKSTMSAAEANGGVDTFGVNSMSNGTEQNSAAFTISPQLYWYINHAYRNELEQIQKQHRVDISAEVLVSIKSNSSTKPDSVSKAFEDLQTLVQGCVVDFNEANVPHTQINSDVVKETMYHSTSERARLVMNISASTFQVFGPKKFTDMINRRVDGTKLESQFTDFTDKAGTMKVQRSSSLEMDNKDLQTHLEMDKVHWDLMNRSYKEQIRNLEIKFGVSFKSEKLQDNLTIKVRAQSREDQHADLENHALRALIQHYQKLSWAIVSCELKDPKDLNTVAQIKDIIDKQHHCVAAVDVYGPLRLVGLPEHLGPSINDIEKKIGGKVFDEETKNLIGYSGDILQGSGIAQENSPTYWQRAAGGPIQDEAMSSRGRDPTDSGFSVETQENEISKHDSKDADGEKEQCVICLDNFVNKTKLQCGHEFCQACIDKAVDQMGKICPVCKKVYGKLEGNQPPGTMKFIKSRKSLPGYQHNGTIEITYDIPDGIQMSKHPNPGQRYSGTHRTAYLPDNEEGNHILKLLQRAFDQKLIFTVGISTTTGSKNVVTWNDIHHKTNPRGGPECYGYPDSDYLKRVKDELKAKGIE